MNLLEQFDRQVQINQAPSAGQAQAQNASSALQESWPGLTPGECIVLNVDQCAPGRPCTGTTQEVCGLGTPRLLPLPGMALPLAGALLFLCALGAWKQTAGSARRASALAGGLVLLGLGLWSLPSQALRFQSYQSSCRFAAPEALLDYHWEGEMEMAVDYVYSLRSALFSPMFTFDFVDASAANFTWDVDADLSARGDGGVLGVTASKGRRNERLTGSEIYIDYTAIVAHAAEFGSDPYMIYIAALLHEFGHALALNDVALGAVLSEHQRTVMNIDMYQHINSTASSWWSWIRLNQEEAGMIIGDTLTCP